VEIRTVEASMHGSLDRSDETHDGTDRSWSIGFFALPVLVVIALVTLAIVKPAGFTWISDAAQAEFVGMNPTGAVPTEIAKPAMQIRTVKAY
jgi:fumarate reductase subunit C